MQLVHSNLDIAILPLNSFKIFIKLSHTINTQIIYKAFREMHMKTLLLFVITGLLLISCNESQLPQPGDQSQYELWKSKNIHNYSVEQVRTCFCPDAGERVRLTVKADTIFSIVRISDGQAINNANYHSIESLFSLIHQSTYDSLSIKYNREYGYPELLDINPQLHPVDGGVLYTTSNLQLE